MFKDVYKAALGEKAAQYQTVGFLVSSACAEVIADVLLCPFEAVSEASTTLLRRNLSSVAQSFLLLIDPKRVTN